MQHEGLEDDFPFPAGDFQLQLLIFQGECVGSMFTQNWLWLVGWPKHESFVSSYLTSFNVVWTFSGLPCLNFFLNHPNVNTAG